MLPQQTHLLPTSDADLDWIARSMGLCETPAARQALEWQRAQAKAEYAQGVVSDLAEAELKAAPGGRARAKIKAKYAALGLEF